METPVRRPDAPNHFMVLKPINKRVIIRLPSGEKLADSTQTIRLLESGKTLLDPVVYFPEKDICATLAPISGQTTCPLKGDASYFAYGDGEERIDKLAWSYQTPLDFARDIQGLIAFYGNKVIIEEHPQ